MWLRVWGSCSWTRALKTASWMIYDTYDFNAVRFDLSLTNQWISASSPVQLWETKMMESKAMDDFRKNNSDSPNFVLQLPPNYSRNDAEHAGSIKILKLYFLVIIKIYQMKSKLGCNDVNFVVLAIFLWRIAPAVIPASQNIHSFPVQVSIMENWTLYGYHNWRTVNMTSQSKSVILCCL